MTTQPIQAVHPDPLLLDVSLKEQFYLIIGQSYSDPANANPTERHLVAIAKGYEEAKRIIGQDYLNLIRSGGADPLTSTIWRKDPESGNVVLGFEYMINGYSWQAIPVEINTMLNFSM